MTAHLALNGDRVVSGRVTFPQWGAWVADVVLATAMDLTRNVTLQLGALSAVGIAFRTAGFSGARSARIIGGKNAGWRSVIPARGYSHDAGVRFSAVAGDAARECGETIQVDRDFVIGTAYARKQGKASRVLRRFVNGQWWIDPSSGITHVGDRDASPIRSKFTVETYSGGMGLFHIATDVYEDWMPGRTFVSPTVTTPQIITSVTLEATNEGQVRLHVLNGATKEERIAEQVRQIVREELAAVECAAIVRYKIVNASSSTIDATPVDPSKGWPALSNVPLGKGFLGETTTPAPGDIAIIAFLDMDPTRPEVMRINGTPASSAIDATTTIRIGTGARPAAAAGDFAGPFPIVPGQFKTLV